MVHPSCLIKKVTFLTSIVTALFLSGCSSVSGNVVPKNGPTMEEVYDSMGGPASNRSYDTSRHYDKAYVSAELTNNKPTNKPLSQKQKSAMSTHASVGFKKVTNPELKVYIYPHLAGSDQSPVPGYYTEFNAYEKTHYEQPELTVRG